MYPRLNSIHAEVRRLAREAGLFLKRERTKFDSSRIEEKSAHNYVSYVDKESEAFLVESLSRLLPEAGFVTEEGSATHRHEKYWWVIDPLDGTTNYIHNTAPYCVSIALRDETEILLGVVYEVCREECFYACKGGKSFLNGQEIQVSGVSDLDRAFIALGLPYQSEAYKPVALRLIDRLYGQAGGCRLQGSAAAEICYVAAGRFEARIEAFLGPWDVAAASLILTRAGGRITDFSGGASWPSGDEVIASNGKIHPDILALLSP
ncbi:MAG: inositol monophosphatase [Tannerellaceae bacterium]|jgi:myo-inositol-1(or 4)-monophosphatase|nr:inositol monophosphatase [Tannerellaceae bacterium]